MMKPSPSLASGTPWQPPGGGRVNLGNPVALERYCFSFRIPRVTGQPGKDGFRVHFDGPSPRSFDMDVSLEALRGIHHVWDSHLSTIKSPSARLDACLRLIVDDSHAETPARMPLLFPGERVQSRT